MRLSVFVSLGVSACASRAAPGVEKHHQPATASPASTICRLADPSKADLVTLAKQCPDYTGFEDATLSTRLTVEIHRETADIMMRQARAHPDSALVLYNAAGVNMGLRTRESVELLKRAAQLEPDVLRIRINLAHGYYLMGNSPSDPDRMTWVSLAFDAYRDILPKIPSLEARRPLLDYAGDVAVWAGHLDAAHGWAEESLAFAASTPRSWDTGNALHHGHRILGAVALARGDHAKAREHLVSSCQGPSSPQLGSFGPDFSLAQALLEKRVGAEKDVVLALSACQKIWDMHEGRIAGWIAEIERGEIPRLR